MKRFFNKMLGRPADSFDQVEEMTTRRLPIPALAETDKYVQFTATRTKEGYWELSSKTNIRTVTAGVQKIRDAFPLVIKKHLGSLPAKTTSQPYNFDNAFLILREFEESLLKYAVSEPKVEPDRHYMKAYRLLPRQFQEGLDELFAQRLAKDGDLLGPAPAKEAPKDAAKAFKPN